MKKVLIIAAVILIIVGTVYASGCIGIGSKGKQQISSATSRIKSLTSKLTTSTGSSTGSTSGGIVITTANSSTSTSSSNGSIIITPTTTSGLNITITITTQTQTQTGTNAQSSTTLVPITSTITTVTTKTSYSTITLLTLPVSVAGGISNVDIWGTSINGTSTTLLTQFMKEAGTFGTVSTFNYVYSISGTAILLTSGVVDSTSSTWYITRVNNEYISAYSYNPVSASYYIVLTKNGTLSTMSGTNNVPRPYLIPITIPTRGLHYTIDTAVNQIYFSVSGIIPNLPTYGPNSKEGTIVASGTYNYKDNILIVTAYTYFNYNGIMINYTGIFTVKPEQNIGPVRYTQLKLLSTITSTATIVTTITTATISYVTSTASTNTSTFSATTGSYEFTGNIVYYYIYSSTTNTLVTSGAIILPYTNIQTINTETYLVLVLNTNTTVAIDTANSLEWITIVQDSTTTRIYVS